MDIKGVSRLKEYKYEDVWTVNPRPGFLVGIDYDTFSLFAGFIRYADNDGYGTMYGNEQMFYLNIAGFITLKNQGMLRDEENIFSDCDQHWRYDVRLTFKGVWARWRIDEIIIKLNGWDKWKVAKPRPGNG
jgi:hypothetical protein